MRILSYVAICLMYFTGSAIANGGGYIPKDGFVPREEVAIQIAIAVWTPIYGEEKIENERPFKAVLVDDNWEVRGTLPTGMYGGTAFARISKQNGTILMVTHYK